MHSYEIRDTLSFRLTTVLLTCNQTPFKNILSIILICFVQERLDFPFFYLLILVVLSLKNKKYQQHFLDLLVVIDTEPANLIDKTQKCPTTEKYTFSKFTLCTLYKPQKNHII